MSRELGARVTERGTRFRVWSTRASRVAVRLFDGERRAVRTAPMARAEDGVLEATLEEALDGALYAFVLDDETELPDPYARSLPFGVHGPARVVGPLRAAPPLAAPPFARWTLYELHVGAFTPEGTFRAAAEKLPYLAELGISAVELMPIHAFDGDRGWGYDGVALFAPFAPYGEIEDVIAFVARAHALGIAVMLDVVYNHFGPAGNYLGAYSPEYFTARHQTPWGDAPDFTNPFMRAMVVENVQYWLEEVGFDALRLDATHTIADDSPKHVLRELAEVAAPKPLVAEDERNDPSLVRELGMRAVWADDFHHQVRVLLTGEQDGYYRAYRPDLHDLARCIDRGWLYEGQLYAPRGEPRGKPADGVPKDALVYCIQNHDQVGNRATGTRLCHDAPIDAYAAASMLLLFLPAVPLLFMGQEWAASTPFLFFSDHRGELGAKVTEGRRKEFEGFASFRAADIPDPQSPDTFLRSKLAWSELAAEPHARVLALYRAMLALRRDDPVLSARRGEMVVSVHEQVLDVRRRAAGEERRLVVSFGERPVYGVPADRVLVASAPLDAGALPPRAAAVFR